jgi:hypothetical protein
VLTESNLDPPRFALVVDAAAQGSRSGCVVLDEPSSPRLFTPSSSTQAFARLGVDRAAQYLVRPDGHIAYRCGGTEPGGVERYLARWFPGAGREPDQPRP